MSVFLLLLILSEVLLPNLTCASRVRRQATKVRISAIGDTITLRFLEPHRETKLEGYILGYGSSLFSKQLIKLPDDGEPYETEIDAEPKYLVAVQPVKEEQMKKQCTGKESLEKPLHLVIGSVSPTSVMLSWATLLNTLSTETNLDDCTEDGHYTVRYRESEPKKTWNYQTCPTTDTIIDDLKPDTPYEFGVRAKFENINGAWSPSVTHNTTEINAHKILEPENLFQPEPPSTEEPQTFSPSVPVLHIVTESRPAPPLSTPKPPPTQRITEAKDRDVYKPQKPENLQRPEKPVTESPQTFPPSVPVPSSTIQSRPASLLRRPAPPPTQRIVQNTQEPLKPEIILMPEEPITEGPQALSPSVPDLHSVTQGKPVSVLRHTAPPPTQKIIPDVHEPTQPVSRPRHKKPTTERPQSFSSSVAGTGSDAIRTSHPSEDSLFLTQTPTSAHTPMSQEMSSTSATVATTSAPTGIKRVSTVSVPNPITLPPTSSNTTVKKAQVIKAQGIKAQGNKAKGNKTRIPNSKHSQNSSNGEKHKGQKSSKKKKPESTKNKENLNQVDKDEAIKAPTNLNLKNELPLQKPSLTTPPAEIYQKPTPTSALNGDNSSVFSSVPVSEVDIMGKNRFVAPHVIYQINKPPKQPCSVTNSLSFFPEEENVVANISGPPKTPPTNVTVVTVEGCSSFVIIDWEKTDNETTEYDVISSENSPSGKIISVVTTNQTHTAVENLKPESSYEFKVTPKNELGSGPSSESVTFNTESADPRVSEIRTGKNAIWSSFSFKADSYSECNGNQFVKRTWYRKFVGIQLCNSLRYKIYLSDSLKGKFYNIGDETGYGEDHCQFVDSYLDGRTGGPLSQYHLPLKQGYFRSMRQEPVKFGKIGGSTQINYVAWYECGVPIPGSW
ncbi:target of Nesh-SH3 isoform 4-T4 [Clarias gariepinus]|uniref:target of Nesh-SH3 isoform X4 n=1 Tax=Clarias gariepinus TaxID=13013 RepID=UPI00234CC888|nr:target of Nesh-SH3 isoform X4 [Clarias gariepinus]